MIHFALSMKEKTYQILKKFKSKNNYSLIEFFGVLKNLNWKAKEHRMKNLRHSFDKKVARSNKY